MNSIELCAPLVHGPSVGFISRISHAGKETVSTNMKGHIKIAKYAVRNRRKRSSISFRSKYSSPISTSTRETPNISKKKRKFHPRGAVKIEAERIIKISSIQESEKIESVESRESKKKEDKREINKEGRKTHSRMLKTVGAFTEYQSFLAKGSVRFLRPFLPFDKRLFLPTAMIAP